MKSILLRSFIIFTTLFALTGCIGGAPKVSNSKTVQIPQNFTLEKPLYVSYSFYSTDLTLFATNIQSKKETSPVTYLLIKVNKYGNPKAIINRTGVRLTKADLNKYISEEKVYFGLIELNEINKLYKKESSQFDKYIANAEANYKKDTPKFTITVNDKSGLYDNSIDFKTIVSFKYNNLKPKIDYQLPSYLSMHNYKPSKEFKNKQFGFYQTQKSKILKAFSKAKTEANIEEKNKFVTVQYNKVTEDKFNYSIDKKYKFYFNKRYTINVNINSANIKLDYPILPMQDDTLAISASVGLANKTGSFVSIKTLSYYLNGAISKVIDNLELEPEAYVTLPMSTFHQALIFKNTTKEKLKATKIRYGIAVKYTSSNTTNVKSLYKQTTKSAYNLYKQQ